MNHSGSFGLDDGSDYMLMDAASLFQSSDQEASLTDDSLTSSPQHFYLQEQPATVLRGYGDDSYLRRRQRNNAAVRRSREKARQKQRDSAKRLAELTADNNRLRLKYNVLFKELNLLRGLFPDQTSATGSAVNQHLLAEVDHVLSAAQ